MMLFPLEILTPENVFFKGDCLSIVFPTTDGMIGVMANHSPLISAIGNGRITFTTGDGTSMMCAVSRGMISVNSKRVRILCESAVFPEDIDEKTELLRMQEAEIEMRKQQSYEAYVASQLAFAKAFNNLKVKQYSAVRTNQ